MTDRSRQNNQAERKAESVVSRAALFRGVLTDGDRDEVKAGRGEVLPLQRKMLVEAMQDVWLGRLRDQFGIAARRIESRLDSERDEPTVVFDLA